jgi:serine/threonine-protein kinase
MSDTRPAGFSDVWRELQGDRFLEQRDAGQTVSYDEDPTHTFSLPKGSTLPQVKHLFVPGERIGAGGNGEVIAATQVSLDRKIAVKKPLRTTKDDESRFHQLLREARIIGYLEHPNIPPVHFVGQGDGAQDLVVGLKHIEGEEFLCHHPMGMRVESVDEALDVLIDVCDAVGYAHDNGIVHVDLKPSNVMIGRHGEVYLLDWGLAVAYRDDVPDWIPRFIADGKFRGTPAYGAPETVSAQPPTAATDVYQLGGLLHRILTGYPPNRGKTTYEVLAAAFHGMPRTFDERVPAGLAAICTKALARDPAERYPDANAFRLALVTFRRNVREFEALERAQACVSSLVKSIERGAPNAEIYRAYGATRLAVVEYERLDQSGDAASLRLRAVRAMLEWEVNQGNAGGAELLLEELPEAQPELRSKVLEIRAREARDRAELAELRKDADVDAGRWPRFFFWMLVGFIIFLTEAIPHSLGVEAEPQRVFMGHSVFLLLLGALTIALRKKLNTGTNRRIVGLVWVMSSFGLALRGGALLGRLDLSSVVGLDLFLVALVTLYGAFQIDRRVAVAVPLYLGASAVAVVVPEAAMLTFGVGHFFALTAVAAMTTFVASSR